MNKKITFPELVDALSETNGISKRVNESLLKDFFSLIQETLEQGETVKIKGLGIFKVVKVEARKSINVNTGKEIEIPAHFKVSFAPDKELAKEVNTAFADFETVELDDNISEEEINSVTETSASDDKTDEETTKKIDEKSSDNKGEVSPSINTVVPVITNAAVNTENREEQVSIKPDEETETQNVQDSTQAESSPKEIITPDTNTEIGVPVSSDNNDGDPTPELERQDTVAENSDSEKSEDISFNDEQASDNTESDSTEASPVNDITEEESEENTSDKDIESQDKVDNSYQPTEEYEEPQKVKSNFYKGFFCGAIFATIAILLSIYLFSRFAGFEIRITEENNITEKKGIKEITTDKKEEPQIKEPATQTVEEPTNKTEKEVSAVEPPHNDTKIKYDVVTKTRYLATMAREYYGDTKFWVYIYEENKQFLRNPNKIKPGTRVVIPPISKYYINKNDQKSLDVAEQKAHEIYLKYK